MNFSKSSFVFFLRQKLLPILYPRHCPVCRRVLPYGKLICTNCYKKLPFTKDPVCYRCGKPITNAEQEYCYDCRLFPKSFQRGRSLFLYNEITQPAMIRFKYHNERQLSYFYTSEIQKIHGTIIHSWQPDAIIPIPIHKRKQKKRGYNQAELLCKELAFLMNLPCYPDFLIRDINTLPQKQFSPQARLTNLQKAFKFNLKYASKLYGMTSVLIIDDIYTTGATMEACTRILHEAGIKNIYIYSICIGISRD